jgi:hypothetical protein
MGIHHRGTEELTENPENSGFSLCSPRLLRASVVNSHFPVLRHSNWDALLIGLSFVHLSLLWLAPSIPLIAIGVWWNSNTISHNFVHLPFFHSRTANRVYGLYLSALLGIPQTLWRDRHLAHHRGHSPELKLSSDIALESGLIFGLWALMLLLSPRFFWITYLPGFLLGLSLCYLHGYFEHAGGTTTSHYGMAYNLSFFNDGYHVEHHARPGEHWTHLPSITAGGKASRWPAVLRWMEAFNLEGLETIALKSPVLQRFLLRTHEQAMRKLLTRLPHVRTVTIVGGGMYPRTALLLRRLLPDASIRILDAKANHLDTAKSFLNAEVEFEQGLYIPGEHDASDLVVIPLSFTGARDEVYRNPASTAILVHDWIWSKRGESALVSFLLLKRLNLIVR